MRGLCGTVLCATSLVACGRVGFGDGDQANDGAPSDTWDPAWAHRRQLVFGNGTATEDLINFPVLVVLDPTRIDYGALEPAGQDLRFVDADGVTVLPHEIELWDPTGSSYVWVRVPQIDASSTTDHVWMYYGNPMAADAQARETVWAEYRGVWHLGEKASGAVDEIGDSSPLHLHGQGGGGAASKIPSSTAGRIGNAQRFDGADDVIAFSAGASASLNFAVPQLTIEYWLVPDPARTDYNDPVCFSGYNDGFRVGLDLPGTTGVQITGATYTLHTAGTVSNGTWHYMVATYDGTTMRNYQDGIKDSKELVRSGNLDPTTKPLRLGRADEGTASADYPLLGPLDEARIANIARSSVWIAAQYRSMTDAFVTFAE